MTRQLASNSILLSLYLKLNLYQYDGNYCNSITMIDIRTQSEEQIIYIDSDSKFENFSGETTIQYNKSNDQNKEMKIRES